MCFSDIANKLVNSLLVVHTSSERHPKQITCCVPLPLCCFRLVASCCTAHHYTTPHHTAQQHATPLHNMSSRPQSGQILSSKPSQKTGFYVQGICMSFRIPSTLYTVDGIISATSGAAAFRPAEYARGALPPAHIVSRGAALSRPSAIWGAALLKPYIYIYIYMYIVGAALPNLCTWGLRSQPPAVASLLDCNVSSFNIHW